MTNENNDKATGSAQQHQPKTAQQTNQQQKQAGPHDERSCTNPDHNHAKDDKVAGGTKPNQESKPAL
jgi:hypothetical protein